MKWKRDQTTILNENYSSLKNLLEKEPNDSNAWQQLAECCFSLEKYEEAEGIYKNLVLQNSDSCKYYYRLGKIYSAKGYWKVALNEQNKAIELWPNFSWAKIEKAKCLIELKMPKEAKEVLLDISSNIAFSDKDKILFINLYKILFDIYEEENNSDECLKLIEKLINIDESPGIHFYRRGKIHLELKQYEQALTDFTEARKTLNDVWVDDKIAISLAFCGKEDEALAIYKSIPYIRRTDYVHLHFGRLLYKLGDLQNAKIEFRNTLKKPGMSKFNAHYFLGLIYEEANQFRNALQQFELAIQSRKKEFDVDFPKASERIERIKKEFVIDPNEIIEDLNDFMDGFVSKFISERGFGFLKDSSNREIFFHIKNCKFKEPQVGDKVIFEVIDGRKGAEAINIKRRK